MLPDQPHIKYGAHASVLPLFVLVHCCPVYNFVSPLPSVPSLSFVCFRAELVSSVVESAEWFIKHSCAHSNMKVVLHIHSMCEWFS